MKTITIDRYSSTRNGTQSVISVVGSDQSWHGLERPWLDNLPYESCIPTGTYVVLPWESPRYGTCRIFVGGDVAISEGRADRFACLIHPANYTRQLQGCLSPGCSKADYYEPETSCAVWKSRDALSQMQEVLGDDPAECVIRCNYNAE